MPCTVIERLTIQQGYTFLRIIIFDAQMEKNEILDLKRQVFFILFASFNQIYFPYT